MIPQPSATALMPINNSFFPFFIGRYSASDMNFFSMEPTYSGPFKKKEWSPWYRTYQPYDLFVIFEHKDVHKLGSAKTVENMDQGWGMILQLYQKQAVQ